MNRTPRALLVVALLSVATGALAIGPANAQTDTIVQAASCCAPARRVDPPEPPTSADAIALIGDSLTVGIVDDRFQNGPTFQAILQGQGQRVWVHADLSMSIDRGAEIATSNPTEITIADVVVVALGTNDIVGVSDPAELRARIQRLADAIAAVDADTHLVWIDLAFPRLADRAEAFNGVLADIAGRDPRVHHCRWSDAIAANPEWFASDGVHLTGTGYAARRDVAIGCVDAVDISR